MDRTISIIWNIIGILYCLGFLFLGIAGLLELIKNPNDLEMVLVMVVGFAIPFSFGTMHILNLIKSRVHRE